MELEGLKRAMKKILDHDISIGTIVTDCHMQITKWLKENHTLIQSTIMMYGI